MFKHFSARTADELWLQVAAAFRDEAGGWTTQTSRNGATREILHATFVLEDPRQRWVVSRTPVINPAFAIADVLWILCGRNDSAFLNYFNKELPKYAGTGLTYHGAYGYRLRQHLGLDQLDRARRVLEAKPESRQVVLQIWHGPSDLPGENLNEASPDIPCNVISMLKVRDGALEWTQIIRSNDVFLGLPHNFVQFTTLQEVMAGWLGVKVGSYNQISDSLHVYERNLKDVAGSAPVAVQSNCDSLAMPWRDSEKAFRELTDRTDRITKDGTSVKDLLGMLENNGLPPAFQNMLSILVAEGARRRGKSDIAGSAVNTCSNPVYRQLWDRWMSRMADAQAPTDMWVRRDALNSPSRIRFSGRHPRPSRLA